MGSLTWGLEWVDRVNPTHNHPIQRDRLDVGWMGDRHGPANHQPRTANHDLNRVSNRDLNQCR